MLKRKIFPSLKWTVSVLVAGTYLAITPAGAFAQRLKVATKALPPFVIVDPEATPRITGYSIDLWDKIANRLGVDYEFIEYDTVQEALDAVAKGEANLAIAGITITAQREKALDFSFGFYETGLQILVIDEAENPFFSFIFYAFSWETVRAIAILFGMAMVSAHLVWFFERKDNPDMFPQTYREGIWEALWWSMVTATTVGYGDKAPKGVVGRLIAISWMLGAIFVVTYFVAQITANRLQSGISGPEDLRSKRVGAVANTTSAAYLRREPLKLIEYQRIEEAYQDLREHQIQAVVGDAPLLLYYASKNPDLRVVGRLFEKQQYGIAFPQGSPYRESINRIILELKENEEISELDAKWVPASE
uniref:Transporter substrate-binding domain-containing protein n=1 Tax=Planktothricoides sp. SpSt-374 TaxID=2282167 RepID=A0A7C3ZJN3_9CYAN